MRRYPYYPAREGCEHEECGTICSKPTPEEIAYRLWAHNSTCERVVHKMPLDTPEWRAQREWLATFYRTDRRSSTR